MRNSGAFFGDGLYDLVDDVDKEITDFRQSVCQLRQEISHSHISYVWGIAHAAVACSLAWFSACFVSRFRRPLLPCCRNCGYFSATVEPADSVTLQETLVLSVSEEESGKSTELSVLSTMTVCWKNDDSKEPNLSFVFLLIFRNFSLVNRSLFSAFRPGSQAGKGHGSSP